MNIGDALRTHVTDRISALTGKYFDGGVSGAFGVGREEWIDARLINRTARRPHAFGVGQRNGLMRGL